jgi:segregation and condensation protein B
MVAKNPIMRLVKDDQDMPLNDESIAVEELEMPAERSMPGSADRADHGADEAPNGAADGPIDESAGDESAGDESTGDESGSDAQADIGLLEALLFGTQHPLTAAKLVELMGLKGVKPVKLGIKSLNEQYESAGRSFRIEQVAGGYQMLTLPCYGEALKKLHHREIDAKLTKSALETLAIIAYKQPILRADIEAIRGVACGETIRSLMEKHLVKIAGRAEEPGRPILYGTTKRFLELFGLNTLRDLPQAENKAEGRGRKAE